MNSYSMDEKYSLQVNHREWSTHTIELENLNMLVHCWMLYKENRIEEEYIWNVNIDETIGKREFKGKYPRINKTYFIEPLNTRKWNIDFE
jgi:hypothetical protein